MPGHLTNRWHTLRRTYLRSAKSDHITFHPWSNFSADASLPKAHDVTRGLNAQAIRDALGRIGGTAKLGGETVGGIREEPYHCDGIDGFPDA